MLFKQEVQMWKLLFPRWFVVVGLLGVLVMAVSALVFWLMLGYLPVPSGRVLPRGLLIPILFGAAGALIFVINLGEWFVFRMLPLLRFVSQSGWKIGLLKYKRTHCDHIWVYEPNNSKIRRCNECGSYQHSFTQKYPSSGESSINWRDQNSDELRFR